MHVSRILRPALIIIALSLLMWRPVDAQPYTFSDLHNFGNGSDGATPQAALTMAPDGTLYGAAGSGGANGGGTLFAYQDGQLTTLHNFSDTAGNGANSDGRGPASALAIASDGTLYGTTAAGGANGGGTIFSYSGATLTTLYSFPAAGVGDSFLTVSPNGTLYGTTTAGGTNGTGTIFSYKSGNFTTLHTFAAANGNHANSDGAFPTAPLTLAPDGTLYGTTEKGGANGTGTIFAFNGSSLNILHTFESVDSNNANADGAFPTAAVVLAPDGTLYGTAYNGGNNGYGTLFACKSGILTTIHTFSNAEGFYPSAALTLAQDGTLYGTTGHGGIPGGFGTIFSFKNGILTTLYNFSAVNNQDNVDGSYPAGLILDADGALRGIASQGGAYGKGTLFSLSPSNTWTAISIAAGSDGKTRILWTKPDRSASYTTVDGTGGIFHGVAYGPYAGWSPRKIAAGANGDTLIFWTNSDGAASYWKISSGGAITYGSYGPYAGWTPMDFSASSDGTMRILWDNANGSASFWTIAANQHISYSLIYGPYQDWNATHIAAAPSGAASILWTKPSGVASFWRVATNNSIAYSPSYGPYAGWHCDEIGVGSDGKTRLLWNNINLAASFWTLNDAGDITYGPTWGPYYLPWSPETFAVAPDGSARLLWDNTSEEASYWTVTPSFGITYSAIFGPT